MKKISITLCILLNLVFINSCESNLKWDDFAGGTQVILNVEQTSDKINELSDMHKILNIIKQRLESFDVKTYIVKDINNNIIVQLAKYDQIDRIINLLTKRAKFEFRVVESPSKDNFSSLENLYFESQNISLYVNKESKISNQHIDGVDVRISTQNNKPYLLIEFNDIGSKIFLQITSENINNRLAIVIDDKIYSAPVIREKISGGTAMVTGNFSTEEAVNLSIMLKHGSFPKKVKLLKVENLEYKDWLGKKQ